MSHLAHQQQAAAIAPPRAVVLTLSDTRTPATDTSGQAIVKLLAAQQVAVMTHDLIKDDPDALRAWLDHWLGHADIDLVLTTGGTGVSSRDNTVPVIESFLDTPLPGFGELFRALSYPQIGPAAMLSRALGGVAQGKLLFALPGSKNAVELAMTKLILPELKHLLDQIRR